MTNKIERFAKEVIELHGFSSNEFTGFSCYIHDPYIPQEGFLIWNYSRTHRRFETQIQKFHSMGRIARMEEHFGIQVSEYADLFTRYIESYLTSLKETGLFYPIGSGIKLFGKHSLKNLGAKFEFCERNLEGLRKFEQVIINNSIVHFAEKRGYFECKKKNLLAWDRIFKE